mmetsp:Transcript_46614/g.92052  ORF Transcript_46614/g.92052 Transcript_46614/m.92052 type:complete len:135 (+) Transcript_46614:567-971(+)
MESLSRSINCLALSYRVFSVRLHAWEYACVMPFPCYARVREVTDASVSVNGTLPSPRPPCSSPRFSPCLPAFHFPTFSTHSSPRAPSDEGALIFRPSHSVQLHRSKQPSPVYSARLVSLLGPVLDSKEKKNRPK